jgi:hypothetical protein
VLYKKQLDFIEKVHKCTVLTAFTGLNTSEQDEYWPIRTSDPYKLTVIAHLLGMNGD